MLHEAAAGGVCRHTLGCLTKAWHTGEALAEPPSIANGSTDSRLLRPAALGQLVVFSDLHVAHMESAVCESSIQHARATVFQHVAISKLYSGGLPRHPLLSLAQPGTLVQSERVAGMRCGGVGISGSRHCFWMHHRLMLTPSVACRAACRLWPGASFHAFW